MTLAPSLDLRSAGRVAPLTPPDCDLRDFVFMPLDVRRLRDSDLAAEESPEACWAAVLLWGASWHQVPAASLPEDDRVLANLAGYGRVVKEWLKVKPGALRGFVRCNDGRLYHPVVAEKAREAWRGKLEQRWRTECARIKKHNQRTGESLPVPTLEVFMRDRVPWDIDSASSGTVSIVPKDSAPCPRDVPRETASKGKGTGKGNLSEDKSSAAGAALVDPGKDCWRMAKLLLAERDGLTGDRPGKVFGKILADHGVQAADLFAAVAKAAANGTEDVTGYLTKAAQRIANEKGSPKLSASELAMRSNIQ